MASYDLLTEKWIPIIWANGNPDKVGIRDALTKAGQIREVHASSPLDTVALYRFLLAVLQWCKRHSAEQETARIPEQGFPLAWVKKLDDQESNNRFELLGEAYGFYQDRRAWQEVLDRDKKRKKDKSRKRAENQDEEEAFRPATDLLQELPSGSNVAHFRHTRDNVDGLCPGCCALGLIRLSAFVTHSAHGSKQQKPAGINGATPVYALPVGGTLLQTMRMNCRMPQKPNDQPGWMNDDPLKKENIGCEAALSWRPRRVWLERPSPTAPRKRCTYCGAEERLITQIAFLPGWARPFEKSPWRDDPHLLVVIEPPKSERSKPKVPPVTLPKPSNPPDMLARTWRRLYRAALQSFIPDLIMETPSRRNPERKREDDDGAKQPGNAPPQHTHLSTSVREAGSNALVTIAFFGPAANKALYQDGKTLIWSGFPTSLANDMARKAITELDWLNHLDLRGFLKTALPRHAKKRPEIEATLATAAVEAEARLREGFERFVNALASNSANAQTTWREEARECLEWELHQACQVLQKGSPLCRGAEMVNLKSVFQQAIDRVKKQEQKGGET